MDAMLDTHERFQRKVEISPDGCWLWKAYKNESGYGYFKVFGKWRRAHRVSYEIHIGDIPSGLTLDHLCRIRHCVNPEHLEAVSLKENLQRGESKPALNSVKLFCKRNHPLYGENLHIRPDGKRRCKQCNRERQRKSYRRETEISH